jgi:nitroreductase
MKKCRPEIKAEKIMKIRPISVCGVPRDDLRRLLELLQAISSSSNHSRWCIVYYYFFIYIKSKQLGLKTKLRCARLALQFHAYGLFYSMDQAHISHLGPAP